MASYSVYILRCSDGTLYTGITTELGRRLEEHNSGRGSRYTRSRRPVQLAYAEEAPTRRRALKREIEIKRLDRASKLRLCDSHATRRHS